MSTIALLQRHQRLEMEMGAYASEVKRLSEQAQSAAQLAPLTVSNYDLREEEKKSHQSSDSLRLPWYIYNIKKELNWKKKLSIYWSFCQIIGVTRKIRQ